MTSQKAMDLAPLLTEQQAADLVGVAYRTWRRWSRSGLAPTPIKIGRGVRPAVRYRRDELFQWVDDGCPVVDQDGQ